MASCGWRSSERSLKATSKGAKTGSEERSTERSPVAPPESGPAEIAALRSVWEDSTFLAYTQGRLIPCPASDAEAVLCESKPAWLRFVYRRSNRWRPPAT